jgi:predicted Zn-dependent peptidase
MNKRILALAAAAVILAALVQAGPVTLDVKEHVLANGMKILMIPKPGVPRVVCHVYFRVGSINERPGITGSAHVHEHLMFKGTEVMGVTDYAKESAIDARIDELMAKVYREKYWKTDGDEAQIAAWQKEVDDLVQAQKAYVVKDDLWTQYMKNGGTGLNASTSQETTGYYVTLPSNKIELQMLMESDRMMNARFREFYSEKDVIMEERRLSENRPGYLFGEQVQAAFYTASPYQWDVIGWMDDLKKMTKEELVAFHNTYYVPNNAVAIYVGDFDPKAVTAMAEKYFGRIPKGPDLEPIRTGVPAQYSEKRFYGEGPAPTSLQMMFHIPPDGDQDTAALSVLAGTLGSGGGGFRGGMGGGGGTGRLYKNLVRDKQLAVSASASSRPQWYAGAFQFNATPRVDKGVKPEDLEKEIWAEVEKIKKEGLTEEEILKAKNKGEAMFVRSLGSTAGLASRVGRAELKRGWRSILTDLDDLQKVTNDDIKRVAAKYFVKDNSLTAVYTRKSGR